MPLPIQEHNARRTVENKFDRFQKKSPTRVLILGDGRGGAASNVLAPGNRQYVWARENSNANARYFPILNLGAVQPAANLRVMVGYDPYSQFPNEEQILGSYTTDTIGIGVRVTHNAATSTANSTWRLLSFNTERFNSGSMHSTTAKTSRLIAQTAGLYIISLNVEFAGNGSGERAIQIRRNANESISAGSPIAAQFNVARSTNAFFTSLTTTTRFVIGDYVEAFAFQNSGGNLNVNSVDEYTPEFSMVRIEQNIV